jgi:ferritin-like metal-binding protein YciE
VGKRCDGMDGLIEESRTIIDKTEDGTLTRDVGLIASAQKIEHYEIATYGTLKTIAAVLDLDDQIIDLLTETLEEEKEVDQKLTQLAESHINEDAREEEN